MEEFKQQCLRSFSINRSGEVVHKDALPAPRQVTFDANPGKLQDMVDLWFTGALGGADVIGVLPLMSVICDVPGVNSGGIS